MILSVCPTTTLERNWVIPRFSVGGFHRVKVEMLFASGKGVNVARVIKTLNGEVVCAGFVGGFTGQLFQTLAAQENIIGYWMEVQNETRESITVYDPESEEDTTQFCPSGSPIDANDWENFLGRVEDLAKRATNIVISGNIPSGLNPDRFSAFIGGLGRYGNRVWLDLNGPMLDAGIRATPFAIKVNAKECSELINRSIRAPVEALQAAQTLRDSRFIPLVSITLGPGGAVCSSLWGDWIVHPLNYSKVVNSVGCGDAFLGGMLVRYTEGADVEDCLRSGTAAAGASTQKLGPGNLDFAEYELALKRVTLERVG